jgi:hypothetical protein
MRYVGFESGVSVSSEERRGLYNLLHFVFEGSFSSLTVRPYIQTYLGVIGLEFLSVPIEQVRYLYLGVGFFVVLFVHHYGRDTTRWAGGSILLFASAGGHTYGSYARSPSYTLS